MQLKIGSTYEVQDSRTALFPEVEIVAYRPEYCAEFPFMGEDECWYSESGRIAGGSADTPYNLVKEVIPLQSLNDANRKSLAALACAGAKFGGHGKMCSTCAFKLNSDANFEPHNVEAAWDCLAYDGQFNCHVTSGVNKGCVCIGFKYAQAALQNGCFIPPGKNSITTL